MSEETLQERQDNEIEALKAIFGDQLVDNRPTLAWNVWRPMDVMLTLLPLHSSAVVGVHCSITLHIQCCENYPDKPPKLAIHKLQGISNDNAAKLMTELEAMCTKLCGEVMIYEIAQHVQNFLHQFNKPTLSFYDEMLERKNEQERLKQSDLERKEKEEREKVKSEIRRRQEILKGAGRQRHHLNSLSQEAEVENDSGQGDSNELVLYYSDSRTSPVKKVSRNKSEDAPCTCTTKGVQVLRITQKNNKKIHIGRCIDHSTNGSTTYLAIDADNGDFLVAKKYVLKLTTDFQNRNRQLNLIEQDLKAMSRLQHSSLVPYWFSESVQESIKNSIFRCIYIFRSFVIGTSLKFLKSNISFGDSVEKLKFLRHIAVGVFGALKELHSVDVLHRCVCTENIFIDEARCVKLVGAALDVRLAEVAEGTDGDSYCDRHTKGQDIFAAAQVLLSLVISEGADGHEVPSQLPSAAKDMFSRCLTEDERQQWSAEKLLTHEFLKEGVTHTPATNNKNHNDIEDEEQELAKTYVSHTLPASGHSRLNAEFEVLTWLGKGAFGDVLKVKNKLDGRFYAIKRIKLNPVNVQLNKKITREVKLLSQLNHESIVRYYNAWIETIEDEETRDEDVVQDPKTPTNKHYQASMDAVMAKLGGPGVRTEWSMSEGLVKREETSDDDSSDDDGLFHRGPANESSSPLIEFEDDGDNQSETIPSELASVTSPSLNILQVLYIQMEFCEKHTLRVAIDNGLYLEHVRAWRLFREIIEGLNHVHQLGMIHRDLKPVNIFLDSSDHVKIGDFGLATNAFTKLPAVEDRSKAPEDMGGSLTGQIGTALYVAPELLQGGNKMIYNQKVDIYSVGMILFEMFHRPLDTAMERMKVLTDLRSKEIVMPKAFLVEENSKQIHVIRWLLSHEPSNRPSCAEILSSEYVPRPVAENTLSALLAHAIRDRTSRHYRKLVSACLDQRPTKAEDFTYHSGLKTKPDIYLAAVKHNVVKVLQSHGALEFSPALLCPRAAAWDAHPAAAAVRLMTANGNVCHLPHDLRLPLARHVAYTETKSMRRYVVDRVFREKHVEGFHPKEIVECAFDIVTPKTGSLWPDAELLLVAYQAACSAKQRVSVVLNHKELLTTLLVCCGVAVDKQAALYPILVQVRDGRITNLQLQTHLSSLCITKRDITNLLKLMDSEVYVSEVKELVAPYIRKSEWSRAVSNAISDIETVTSYAKALGLDCAVYVSVCLAYSAQQHSGVFWALTSAAAAATSAGHTRRPPLLAVGGRYDSLVEEFWSIARTEKDHKQELKCSCVGFSMSLERMAAAVKRNGVELNTVAPDFGPPKVCIYLPPSATPPRLAEVARTLWSEDISTCIIDCADQDHNAQWMVVDEGTSIRVVDFGSARVREHRIQYVEVVDFIKQKLNPDCARPPEGCNRTTSFSGESSSLTVSVTFLASSSNEKMSKNMKRHHENQINSQAARAISRLGGMATGTGTGTGAGSGVGAGTWRWRVAAVAAAAERAPLCCLASLYSVDPDHVRTLADLFPRRRKLIEEVSEELTAMMSSPNNQPRSPDELTFFAVYSIPDSVLKLVM